MDLFVSKIKNKIVQLCIPIDSYRSTELMKQNFSLENRIHTQLHTHTHTHTHLIKYA